MGWEITLQIIQTAAVVIGVVFALMQLRQLRTQREVQAGIELLHPLQAPESAEALLVLHQLPDNLSGEDLRKRLGDDFGPVLGVLGLFESLGPLVARGHVPIEMYADFYRGVTVLCWRKLERYIEEQRKSGWPNLFEWLQWLAERMEERTPADGDVPAFERFRDWADSADYERLCKAKSS
jgi:hypothetical protein